jgi:molecular chaperone GrpE
MADKQTDDQRAESGSDNGDAGIVVEVDTADTSRLGKLEAEVARLDAEKKDVWDRLVRTTADFDNFRKRTKRELDDARSEAKTRVLKEMLPVLDNLERAVQHAEERYKDDVEAAAITDGVKLVLRQFGQALERSEVTPVDAAGQPFDPAFHEAISQQETDAQPPGTVVQVYQKGYKIGDRLLRPALVVVAKARPAEHHGPNGGSAGEATGGEG